MREHEISCFNKNISRIVIYVINLKSTITICRIGKVKKTKEVENLNDCKKLLSKNKHSSEVIKEILKWYDYRDKKGVASF